MSSKRYTEEFKVGAVKQVVERGHPVLEVADRLGVTNKSLYDWIKKYGKGMEHYEQQKKEQEEIRRLKAELKRVTMERDILKKATAYFAKEPE